MKKIFQLILAITLTLQLSAQAPQKFSYQAVIRNSSNNLVTNAPVKMRISILQGSSSGTVVYSELHSPTTNVNGLVSIEIGSGTNQTGSFANINWGAGTFFLKTETDPANGTNYSIVGSTQLLSTPYALYAVQSANGVPGTSNLGDMLYWDGSKWQKIPVGKFGQSLKINNQTLPSWSGDSYAVVQTLPVTNINGNTFTANMNLVSMGLNTTEPKNGNSYKGICWGRNPNPVIGSGNYISDTFSAPGNYSFNIGSQQSLFYYTNKLLYNTKYYVRAFASNGAGVVYGNEVTLTTENGPIDYPSIGYLSTYNIKDSSFDFYYSLQEEGAPVTSTGVIWSTSPEPTIDLSTKTSNTLTNNYVIGTVKGLKPYTQYYARPYAVNIVGIAYGNERTTVTSGPPPTIVTTPITALTANTANLGGNITADGGTPVISRGVVYSKNVISVTNPYNNSFISVQSGSGMGDYTTEITSLTPNTTYYARAFATNISGTFYGNQISFKTLDGPTVTLPQNDELWLVGAASEGGWNNPLPEPYLTNQKFTKLSSTKYELVTNLKPNDGYLILPVMGSWSSSYRLEDNVNRQATVDSGRFVLKTSGGQDFLSPAVGGKYRIILDFKRGMFNLINQETAPVFNTGLNYGTITDIDQNIYKTIQIGTQTWMAENLKVTRYRNGVVINNLTDNTQWQSNIAGAWSYYNNSATNNAQYGKLYNWFAVNNTNKICPTGWHVPTDAEWTTLETFLEGTSVSGGKMKSQGITYWLTPNTGADNSSGFSALPGGYRLDAGTYQGTSSEGIWWSASEATSTTAWYRYLGFNRFDSFRASFDKGSGFSVRCVKD